MKRFLLVILMLPLAATLVACESTIQPMRPLQRVELWMPDDGSPAIQLSKPTLIEPDTHAPSARPTTRPTIIHPVNASASQPATTQLAVTTQSAPTTQEAELRSQDTLPPNLPPGHKIVKIIDPNQTSRFVYDATYDNIWQQSLLLVAKLGFAIDRHDYRLGTITTFSLPSAQVVEFWKPSHSGFTNALENTVNSQRRYLRLTISNVQNKPKFYDIAVQVLVERETNTTETLAGPLFIEGSGFGRNTISLRSDYADPTSTVNLKKATQEERDAIAPRWLILGHDTILEQKIIEQLFDRI